ncbi:MAG: hypothetical protein ACXIUZ_02085 [Lysobacteraceae bacterium]
MSYRRATPPERRAYAAKGAVYPLHGFLTTDSGHVCPVEDLRGSWSRPDPVWELRAPPGFHLKYEGTHGALEHTLADILLRHRNTTFSRCVPGGPCGCMAPTTTAATTEDTNA